MFVNRERELARIGLALERKTAQLIAIYGRRRCGKSALLRRILPAGSVYYAADLREMPLQILSAAKEISHTIPGFDRAVYPDWETLLLSFNQALKKPVTLCLDEFPYLVKNNPELPSVLQKISDKQAHDQFHMVLCGSSQQMMQNMLLDSHSPLYGRCDEIIRVNPMELREMAKFLEVQASQAIEEYAVWGGVPRYWEIRRQSPDLAHAVRYNLLDENGILHDEPERLFADEMRTSVQAFTIISLIAGGSNRLSEIAARIGKPATHLSRILGFLCDLDYIRREIPFGEPTQSSKKSLYKLNDPFLKFYFTFVVPNKSRLKFGLIDEVWTEIASKINLHFSEIWEEQCRLFLIRNEIAGRRFQPGSRWWGGGTDGKPLEIDYVAESDDHKMLLIAEMKWSDHLQDQEIIRELNRKSERFPLVKGRSIIKVICIKNKSIHTMDDISIFDSRDVAGNFQQPLAD